MCAMDGRKTVVVTGFGPFRQFFVNPSWTAAQELQLIGLGEQTDVYIKELAFVVHLGIARGSKVIMLEQTGKNSGYTDKDVCGFCPESHCCVKGGPEKLDSVVNMRAVCKEFTHARTDVVYSRDAGGYLCDFAYYCSLHHGQRRAALIHLPSSLAPADTLAPVLQSLIRTMLNQLE